MDAIAIVGALIAGVVLGTLIRREYDKATIAMLTRQRDEAREEHVGRLTSVYWQGVRNARMQAQAGLPSRQPSRTPEDTHVVELAEARDRRHTERGRAS